MHVDWESYSFDLNFGILKISCKDILDDKKYLKRKLVVIFVLEVR